MVESNGEDVSDWIDAQRRDFVGQVEETLDRNTERTLEEARDEVPVDTGELRDSLEAFGRAVGSDKEYAPHVALGTIFQSGQPYLWPVGKRVLEEELERLEQS